MSYVYQPFDGESVKEANGKEHSKNIIYPVAKLTANSNVLNVQTSAQIKDVKNVENGEEKGVISHVMTSQQSAVRRKMQPSESTQRLDGWREAASKEIEDFQCPAGDRYIEHESKLQHIRSQLSRYLDHLIFRAVTLLLIVTDFAIVITAIVTSETGDPATATVQRRLKILDWTAFSFSCFFMVEVSTRIFAQGVTVFFKQLLEILDFAVVLITFIIVTVDVAIDESSLQYIKVIQGFRLLRLIRFAMLLRIAVTQRKLFTKATRLIVSENKRRYQKDGFDIDLCYITDRLIAMSYPSQGVMSVYRNSIDEVSRFFKTKYSGFYRIYNCCSERSYDAEKYFDNSVVRILIDDHNVPAVSEMVEFAADAQQWIDKDRNNVMAVHCKGGKGRTGTIVCVWLIHSGAFTTAKDALEYFASRRTDLSVSSKYQGVETPSQSRYVGYFEKIKAVYGGKVPAEKRLKPVKISVSGLKGIGTGNGKDLIARFIVDRKVVFEVTFGNDGNCTTLFERETHTITASLTNPPVLAGDVKVMFDATSNIPRDYDDVPWFFWFHTSFIENNELSLGREDLDNPHKEKSWKLYKEDFRVTLSFSDTA